MSLIFCSFAHALLIQVLFFIFLSPPRHVMLSEQDEFVGVMMAMPRLRCRAFMFAAARYVCHAIYFDDPYIFHRHRPVYAHRHIARLSHS